MHFPTKTKLYVEIGTDVVRLKYVCVEWGYEWYMDYFNVVVVGKP